jgi:hypothetical protein
MLEVTCVWAATIKLFPDPVDSVNTNRFFIDAGSNVYVRGPAGKMVIDDSILRKSRLAKDCQPASEDPDGNWGFVTGNLQLSLRFGKETFEVGEAMDAQILVRNVGMTSLLLSQSGRESEKYRFTVVRHPKELVFDSDAVRRIDPTTGIDFTSFERSAMSLNRGFQLRSTIRVSDLVQLTEPGKYYVTAFLPRTFVPGVGWTELSSGTAIVIVKQPETGVGKALLGATPSVASSLMPLHQSPSNAAVGMPRPSGQSHSSRNANNPATGSDVGSDPSAQPTPASYGSASPILALSNQSSDKRNRVRFSVLVLLALFMLGYILVRARVRARHFGNRQSTRPS